MLSPSQAHTISISHLVANGGDVPKERYQEPTLQQTKKGVWFIRPWVDVIKEGRAVRAKKTYPLGAVGKREAVARARIIMESINRAQYVISSQINFGKFSEEYERLHVKRLAASTRGKYASHLEKHIRPAFGHLMLCDLEPLLMQRWLDSKEEGENALSWATRTDLRNILSSIFSRAIEWGRWKDANPVQHVHAGRKRAAREQRKLTDDQTRRLLGALPADVRLMCCVGLFCTLRVSEILGLQERHLDFEAGIIQVRQRFYRGDLDEPKNDKARRDVPMGYLGPELKRLCKGDPERFVFQIETHPKWGRKTAICRDDRDINQHFLRQAAKDLGFYWKGFGWHSLRREAITYLAAALGPMQALRMAGHASVDMSYLYTLKDQKAGDVAIREMQESLIGKTGEKIQ